MFGRFKRTDKNQPPSTRDFLEIIDIREGIIALTGGGFRAILGIGSSNVDLMGLNDQIGFNKQFGHLLNALDFPITICLRPRTSNIERYLSEINGRYQEELHPGKRDFLLEYRIFLQELVAGQRVMDRPKWIVIPWAPGQKGSAGDTDGWQEARVRLDERCSLVGGFLRRMGVDFHRLSDRELTEVCYNYFNPRASQVQKWRQNYREPALIVTARDQWTGGEPEGWKIRN
ncbi:MAG: hypothetical protein M0021_04850 [Clostridia bacterium]|nr:hypothetical protein [Clostridia bacterium]